MIDDVRDPADPGDVVPAPLVDGDALVDVVASAVGGLALYARAAHDRASHSEANRLNLLHLHGAAGMYIGPLFAAIGPAGMTGTTWGVLRLVPGMPYSMGVAFFLGGLVLYVATTRRQKRVEVVGLIIMLGCYGVIAASFAGSVLLWVLAWPRQFPEFYAAILAGTAASMLVWAVRPRGRRHRHDTAVHLSVGWAVGFGIGVSLVGAEAGPPPSWYAHGVYAHLAAVLAIHLATLIRRLRAEAA